MRYSVSKNEPFKNVEDQLSRERFDGLKVELAKKGGLGFKVKTGSMEPLIRSGDPIFVVPSEDASKLKRFDLIVFFEDNILICHYVWQQNRIPNPSGNPTISTRSLAGGEDFPVPLDNVLGLVASHRMPRWTRFRLFVNALRHRNA